MLLKLICGRIYFHSTTKKKQSIIYENFKVSLIHKMLFLQLHFGHLLYNQETKYLKHMLNKFLK
jgi:hypothetical protein